MFSVFVGDQLIFDEREQGVRDDLGIDIGKDLSVITADSGVFFISEQPVKSASGKRLAPKMVKTTI